MDHNRGPGDVASRRTSTAALCGSAAAAATVRHDGSRLVSMPIAVWIAPCCLALA